MIFPRCQIEDLATQFLRWEAELRGEGRDCLKPVRRSGSNSSMASAYIAELPTRMPGFFVSSPLGKRVPESPP